MGVSGGGSHVVQQLIYQGIGTLLPIDDQLVDSSNLGRLVGATEADVDTTPKTQLAQRTAAAVDPSITVIEVVDRFPSPAAIRAMRSADVIVACVDTFQARESINAFCRRYLIPLLDIGLAIRSTGERLATADGQLIAALPGRPCLRCWFITDSMLAKERREPRPDTTATRMLPWRSSSTSGVTRNWSRLRGGLSGIVPLLAGSRCGNGSLRQRRSCSSATAARARHLLLLRRELPGTAAPCSGSHRLDPIPFT